MIRKSMLGFVASFFVATLVTFGFAWGLLRVFGSAGPIKDALARSGIYQTVTGDALAQLQKDQPAGIEASIPLGRPEIQNIIKTAASPELLQTKTENALDAVYAWVHGQTPKLALNLELGDVKTSLANGFEQYIVQHVAALPVCAPGAAGSAADDPFNATCRPEGLSPAQIAAQAKNEFLSGEFLKDTTLNVADIKDDEGRTLAEKLEGAPNIYKVVSWSVYGSGLLAALLAVGVILLSATWRAGVKKVSIIAIVVGIVTIAVSLLAETGMHRAVGAVDGALEQSALKVAEALAGSLRSWWLGYGAALIVLGAGALVALRFVKVGDRPADEPASPEPAGKTMPVTQTMASDGAARPPIAPKPPKPTKKLVQ